MVDKPLLMGSLWNRLHVISISYTNHSNKIGVEEAEIFVCTSAVNILAYNRK